MKALILSLCLATVLSSSFARPARADVPGASWAIVVTPLVLAAVLDLQEAWSCYVEGFRRRHPSPRPIAPRPDSLPGPTTPAPPKPAPPPAMPHPNTPPAPATNAPAES